MDKKPLLVEVSDTFSYRVEEDRGGAGMVISGIYQLADVKNRNNRVYPRGLWERTLADNSPFRLKLQSGLVLGEMGHPADGKTRLSNVSHIIRDVWMEDKFLPECVVCKASGPAHTHIMAKEEVLDTPEGRILAELYRKGVQLGVSSRGSGSVRGGSDEQIVADDYKLETFDHVLDPSTPGAYPKQISESVLGAIEKLVSPQCQPAELQGYRRILQDHYESASDAEISAQAKSLIEAIETRLSHGLTEDDVTWEVPASTIPSKEPGAAHARITVEDDAMTISLSNPEVKKLVDAEVARAVAESRQKAAEHMAEADTLRTKLKAIDEEKTAAMTLGRELEVQLRNANFQLEAYKKHISEGTGDMVEMYDDEHTVAQALDAARSIVDELLEKGDGLQEANEILSTRCMAAERYVTEVRARERRQAVMDQVERVIKTSKLSEAKAAEIRPLLTESATVQEVNRTWGRVAKLINESVAAPAAAPQKRESREGALPTRSSITEANKESFANNGGEGSGNNSHDLSEEEQIQSEFAARLVEKMSARG